MVGKKSGKAAMREEGLERTDNNLDLSTWPQVNMINQKNYYTEYLKRDDQYLAFRMQTEEARNRMVREARDKDRALAQAGVNGDAGDTPSVAAEEAPVEEASAAGTTQEAAGSKLIVIHPGSQNLRIGLGSDALPKTVPMVIARKWDKNEAEEDGGEPRPKRLKVDDENSQPEDWFDEEFSKQFTAMSSELKLRMRAIKIKTQPNSKELVANYNKKTPPDIISEHNDIDRIDWTEIPNDPKSAPDFFTGHEALRIPEESRPRYKLFWPLKNGWWNEKDYPTKNLLYQDFATIIEQAIKSQFGISRRKDFAQYSCVFIIPDLFERQYVTTILDIILRDIGFGRVCFQQESLAATFGAGYSSSCIVDIGAQKTAICCVEEGMCVEDSRINIKYGGGDVTETFIKMMLYDHFPYADINLKRRYDFLLAEELKQKFCTMQEVDVSVQTYEFHLRASGQDTRKYYIRVYDETMLAPMGFFKPAIFDNSSKLEGRRKLIDRSYDIYDGSPNDPISAAQITVLQQEGGAAVLTEAPPPAPTPAPVASTAAPATPANTAVAATPSRQQQPLNLLNRLNDVEGTPRSSVAGSPAPEGTPQPARDTPVGGATENPTIFYDPTLEKIKLAEEREKILPIMSLDTAIMTSISHGARGDDRKMRDFFGGIMLIGGGCKIVGLGVYLEQRLRELNPTYQKEILIGPPPRELDPQVLVWKGGSVFGKLSPSGNDSWISQKEYEVLGSRLLVHKCMFPW